MKGIISKLRSRAGESFAEVLVAIFIIAMAGMLLVSLVTASSGLDMAARQTDEDFYKAISQVEGGDAASVSGTITVMPDGGSAISVAVNVYKDGDGMLSAYRVKG